MKQKKSYPYLYFLFTTTSTIFLFCLSIFFLVQSVQTSDWHDFDVFYNAASASLAGKSMYIIVGKHNLPFWYPPWTGWLFILFAIFPKNVGLFLYQGISLLGAIFIVYFLVIHHQPTFKQKHFLIIYALLVPLSLQLISVGQMDYIFLLLIMLIIWGAEKKNDILVGLLYPFLLTKPHLVIPFSLYLFYRTGRKALTISVLFTTCMLITATLLYPNWYKEMFNQLLHSGIRTDGLAFMTLPGMLGRQENWIGTGNLPITLFLIISVTTLLWKFRSLPVLPFLSVTLVASLFCAPRAYAYDLPLIIPALIWLTANNFSKSWWIWATASLLPVMVSFSSHTFLVVIFILALCIYQLFKLQKITPPIIQI